MSQPGDEPFPITLTMAEVQSALGAIAQSDVPMRMAFPILRKIEAQAVEHLNRVQEAQAGAPASAAEDGVVL
ncbi:hypothetical protein Mpop_4243 [Methylorubrum populi BJ001]|jgi:hypothetical protein|uniref:Uncharacterized protein n=1 Tax=Methylorubrum populi (strain ATCC BAA-705 / NCIMB 13946 / BJ001) TaxID=441620 RepID=B1ZDV6_METPB|nr:hypothetical protein [Methylorubrum populi]ACB82349.1 hypothetical protein Mpop_4243 [Methylorubrum populi BJ001]